jgi:hypothetical protein
MREQAQGAVAQVSRAIGLRPAALLSEDDLKLPDSQWVRRAVDLVASTSPPFLLNHGLRSYAFAAALGRQAGLRFDAEVLLIASLLHDLGLTETFDGPAPFELQGARAAHEFLMEEGFDPRRADLVHEAIALHASVGVAPKKSAEIRLCHFGTGVDVAGLRLYEFNKQQVDRLVGVLPRHDFKCAFPPLLERQAALKPDSNVAGMVNLGFCKMIRNAPFRE